MLIIFKYKLSAARAVIANETSRVNSILFWPCPTTKLRIVNDNIKVQLLFYVLSKPTSKYLDIYVYRKQ